MISINVLPWRARSANSRSITVSPVAWSRLPVGSSASSRRGSGAKARAMATRCCSPPDRRDGRWVSRWLRPTASSAAAARAVGVAMTGEFQRHRDIFQRGHGGDQVKRLEHDADARPAHPGERVLIHRGDASGRPGRSCRRWRAPARPAASAGWSSPTRTGPSKPKRLAVGDVEVDATKNVDRSRRRGQGQREVSHPDERGRRVDGSRIGRDGIHGASIWRRRRPLDRAGARLSSRLA